MPMGNVCRVAMEARQALSLRPDAHGDCLLGCYGGKACLVSIQDRPSLHAGRCPALNAARPLALEEVCLIYLVKRVLMPEIVLICQLAGGELRHRVGLGYFATKFHGEELYERNLFK